MDSRWGGPDGEFTRSLGPARAREMMRLGSLGVDGLVTALASSSPWLEADPWQTLRSARWHRSEEDQISVGEAFRAHTVGGWHASGHGTRGYLDVGLPADFVVWEVPPGELGGGSRSPLETPGLPRLTPDVSTPRALLTVVGGRTIHESEGALT
ncbi:amidohydrolase family protein [Arsenicicoccus bolidensis]|uniref:amidohydrolase family protein n=1 Tax=Arsenicicoccus bolidensis TaxID=229480 RepID=UPI00146D1282|nr:amidohydrolase family protein [Arsenicicoccus bolidensis]